MARQSRAPQRLSLPDFAGRGLSLPDAPEAWRCHGQGQAILLLGLGPGQPQNLPFVRQAARVFWLESAKTRHALDALHPGPAAARQCLPAHWREVNPERAVALACRCRICLYLPGLRLDPDFWGPLLGRLDAAGLAPCRTEAPGRGAVLLPGGERQLLHQELRAALKNCGFGPVLEDVPQPELRAQGAEGGCAQPAAEQGFASRWWELLSVGRPALLLSVNMRGLDPEGRVFHLCRALGVPVALWFVDNPWHVLSALRLPWWREAHVFVTDPGFMPGLRAVGARHVAHLPLAVAPHMWRGSDAALPELMEAPLFVGRSAFPGRERFFAAARVPQADEAEAAALLRRSAGPADAPHFFWWQERLGVRPWPGYEARRAGLGAERCAQANRVRWVRAAGAGEAGGLRVLGDEGWHALLPGLEILPQVDYYRALPELYGRAGAVLNVTSLLLPHSLSQRHFDVWASGGLLLSDATRGLEIFSPELTEPVVLRGPEDFRPRLAELRARPERARNLRRAWREHLRSAHSYEHRVRRICRDLGMGE